MGLFKTDAVIDAEIVMVDEVPAVREARAALLKAKEKVAAATAEAARFQPGTMTLSAVTAAESLESAHAALQAAGRNLEEIRNQERDRIRAARLPDEQRLRRNLLAALEEARDQRAALESYKTETNRLTGGRGNYGFDTSHDWPELLRLDFWREACQREGLL
ncbi:MAG: hypothetical protein HY724_00775 [Candidatus Rokubacteria bacterium]|nr:hypothetical protein [Candidatus Rokubacteria bacterium]